MSTGPTAHSPAPDRRTPGWHYALFCLGLAGWLASLLWYAWVADDAYVTFRVIDNAVHGYGLRWNIDERVQAYSNPLWMLIHIPFYWLWPSINYITLSLSFLCTLAAAALLLRCFKPGPLLIALYLWLPWALSKTLTRYASSGLENPLTTLLFAWFGHELWTHRRAPRWFPLFFIVALSLCNRLDTLWAYLPALFYTLYSNRAAIGRRQLGSMLLGMLPIILWLAFSLFYYGFLFPNTKYAKLDTGVDIGHYVWLGLNYTKEFFFADPLMAVLTIGMTLHAMVWRLPRAVRIPGDTANGLALATLAGMLLYWIYVIMVGGSFVSCRFSSLPVFMTLWVFTATMVRVPHHRCMLPILCAGAVLYGLSGTDAWKQADGEYLHAGRMYRASAGKFITHADRAFDQPRQPWCAPGAPVRAEVIGAAGLNAYYDKVPCAHLVDVWGLGDALVARMPAVLPMDRVGHGQRRVYPYYLYAIDTGSLEKMPEALRRYYAPLRLIITGDLWDMERIKTILRFNSGAYDPWREKYLRETEAGL